MNDEEFAHYLGQDADRVTEDLVSLYPNHRVSCFSNNSFITADYDTTRLNVVYDYKTKLVEVIYFG